MRDADVLFGFYADSPALQAVLKTFERPTVYIGMPAGPGTSAGAAIRSKEPTPLQKICANHGVRPLRMAALGFSIGCSGVTACLQSSDGPKLDAAIAIDGIHTKWSNQRAQQFSTNDLLVWQAMAQAAMSDGRLCLITTSSIVPPSFVGTSVTADAIWQLATGGSEDTFEEPVPEGLQAVLDPPYVLPSGQSKDKSYRWPSTTYDREPLYRYRQRGGLVVVNYKNLDPSGHNDHILQAQAILPRVLELYLVPRWNLTDPLTGACSGSGAVSGTRRRR